MFVTDLEDLHCLRKSIFPELRKNYGLKFKDKRILQLIKQNESQPRGQCYIFSSTMSTAVKVIADDVNPNMRIPKLLQLVTECLNEEIHTEYILRKGGSAGRQKLLKKNIEVSNDLKSHAVHDVASILKQWLRELQEPLIPVYLQDVFLKCSSLTNDDDALLLACLLLPVDHLQTLRYLLCFLNKVVAESAVNKMDVHNVSIVMTPNILPCNEKSGKFCKEIDKQLEDRRNVMKSLMKIANKIGYLPENLNTIDLNILKSSEDELDKPDNSFFSSSLSINKRSRKRKSIVSELKRKLVVPGMMSTGSKESINKICLTPGPKRKAQIDLLVNSSKKKANVSDCIIGATAKSTSIQHHSFTPNLTRPNIHFTNTPVSEMNFNSTPTTGMSRRKRGSRTGKSGCFKTPRSKSKNRAPSRVEVIVNQESTLKQEQRPLIKTPEPAVEAKPKTPVPEVSSPLPIVQTPINEQENPPKTYGSIKRSNAQKNILLRGRPNTIRSGLPSPYRQVPITPNSKEIENINDECVSLQRALCSLVVESPESDKSTPTRYNLRRKSISTPNLEQSRILKPRRNNSAKFVPFTEKITEVKMEEKTPPTALENPDICKWISGETFFRKMDYTPEVATKRESVLRIYRDNAGNVKANINKINCITSHTDVPKPEFKTPIGIVPRTPRRQSKRGHKTPVRIPSVFVTGSAAHSIRNRYRNDMNRRSSSLRIDTCLSSAAYAKNRSRLPPNRRHSSVYKSIGLVPTSPLRDSNVANIRSVKNVTRGKKRLSN